MPDEKTEADDSVYRQADEADEPRSQDPADGGHGDADAPSTGVTGTTPTAGGGDAPAGPDSPSTGVEGTPPTEGGGS